MDPKRLILAALVLAGLSGALWWSNKQEPGKVTSPDDAPKILEIPQDQINKLEIRRMGAAPVVLEKAALWVLKAPQELGGDQAVVGNLLSTLAVFSSDRLVDEKPADMKAYGLADPLITVIVGRKDGKTHTVHFGDDTPSGTSSYVRVEGDPKLYSVVTATKQMFDKTWRDLRDKRLLSFDTEKLTSVELGAITFGKNVGGNWTILKPKPLRADPVAADQLVRALAEARLDVLNDTEEEATLPAKFAAAKLVAVAKVTDSKGTQQIEVRKGNEADYFARSSAVEGVFKTPASLGESLGKGLDDFRNKKLFEFGFTQPDRVEVKDGEKSFVFAKSGNDWKRDGKTIDPGSVQQVLDRLRELAAVKFADSAAGAMVAEFTVGKEKVTVTKQGEMYFARRADGPDVYVLDAKTVNEVRELAAGAKEAAAAAAPAAKK